MNTKIWLRYLTGSSNPRVVPVIDGKEISFSFVIPAKAGIRAPGSGRDQRGERPLTGDAHPR
ncbi:hypothetical protein DS62_00160 [Smithella sp. SC_K08D17]|jgi:hypothetical protein|nr:hypothetical protein DS62_00160 [Smithella sp. SC_K08D17]